MSWNGTGFENRWIWGAAGFRRRQYIGRGSIGTEGAVNMRGSNLVFSSALSRTRVMWTNSADLMDVV